MLRRSKAPQGTAFRRSFALSSRKGSDGLPPHQGRGKQRASPPGKLSAKLTDEGSPRLRRSGIIIRHLQVTPQLFILHSSVFILKFSPVPSACRPSSVSRLTASATFPQGKAVRAAGTKNGIEGQEHPHPTAAAPQNRSFRSTLRKPSGKGSTALPTMVYSLFPPVKRFSSSAYFWGSQKGVALSPRMPVVSPWVQV